VLASIAVLLVASLCETATSSSADELGALGFARLAEQANEEALRCLELAEERAPDNPLIVRDLAIAHARVGHPEKALEKVERAIALGDADPEAIVLRTMLLEATGRRFDAVISARALRSAEGDLIGAALRDPSSIYRAAELAQEDSARAALAALVLAADAGERGREGIARLLTETAAKRANAARALDVQNAARALERRLDEHGRILTGARLSATIDHATNPYYLERSESSALRAAFSGEMTFAAPLGIARFDAALSATQHAMLTERARYRELDLSIFSLAMSAELPISPRPASVLIGFRARATDVWGDLFGVHYATALEGGPYMILPLGASLSAELGIYGVGVDFIDRSPSDSQISSQNRDRVGQRATFALSFEAELIEGRVEASFIRDDALGEAFDALGGLFSGRLRAYPGGGLVLETAVSAAAQEFGPVGDLAIIGPAATRTQVRTAVELAARLPLTDTSALILKDIWIRNNARSGHTYTENVLSAGAEVAW
jgi:tetratricopeptide (TPR) repeat protein